MAEPGKVSSGVTEQRRAASSRTYHFLKKEDVHSDNDMVLSVTSAGGMIQTVRLCVLEDSRNDSRL